MSNIAAKTASNIFYQARCKASTHNEQLSSREGAADLMSMQNILSLGTHRSTRQRIHLP